MIIRLIDIVLIVLFGFIVISDIDIKASLRLPSKTKQEQSQIVKKQKEILTVDIDEENRFWVYRQGQRKTGISNLLSLENTILRLRRDIRSQANRDLAIVIRPHEMSTLQRTVDVMDLCDRNGIPKNIARRSLALF